MLFSSCVLQYYTVNFYWNIENSLTNLQATKYNFCVTDCIQLSESICCVYHGFLWSEVLAIVTVCVYVVCERRTLVYSEPAKRHNQLCKEPVEAIPSAWSKYARSSTLPQGVVSKIWYSSRLNLQLAFNMYQYWNYYQHLNIGNKNYCLVFIENTELEFCRVTASIHLTASSRNRFIS